VVGELNRVVLVHASLVLNGEDTIQILPMKGHESRPFFGRSDRELAVELGDVGLAKKVIGLLDGLNTADSQLLRQAALPGPKTSLASAAGLGRVGRNHSDS
jgi:hypothetical protein